MKLTVPDIVRAETPLVMVTAYDYAGAQQAARAGVDLILVGDSLGNMVQGHPSTTPVRLEHVIYHTEIVRRGAPDTFLIADLPFGTYTTGLQDGLRHTVRLMQESGADAVKLEGATPEVLDLTRVLARNGIPVMGHVGLLPQTAVNQGGLKVQGRDEDGARAVLDGALALQEAGAFAVVLEAIPARLARLVTERLSVPTIGIGAGLHCRGQVLVYHDILGIFEGDKKIAKRYAELGAQATAALGEYAREVRERAFPTRENSFVIKDDVLDKLY
ncbi:3-methyl-2-oxobutanoate hydroxymethyltransferase [Deinococcus maricopensis]|uniref:3-methyl-2-oxobutanoate hydroxymethyltransferase n=1 Tax=Deinococcus maricopensis (strain DSM 21211 / LMG 22137 / NRRL B-23946 / LB-34) TaxID=709986 RepID=E8U6D3_DEIML|nr:3-methyl-2-oxobutanoate hydroxymethyltransferase [Deinococcus maricopensis]ADV66622.1 3-methyl-2-oxobutanoatehydroxymethyltransferase [Deinococcus maricopensis DSM 21211]